MILRVAASAAVIAAGLWVPVALAAESWGAIAYSPETRSVGHSSDFDDQSEAESRALEACMETGAADCQVVVHYSNACGAVMAGATGWGVAIDTSEQSAQQAALSACYDKANDCALVLSACSPGGGEPAD